MFVCLFGLLLIRKTSLFLFSCFPPIRIYLGSPRNHLSLPPTVNKHPPPNPYRVYTCSQPKKGVHHLKSQVGTGQVRSGQVGLCSKVYPPSQVEIKKCNVMRCDAMFSARVCMLYVRAWEVLQVHATHHITFVFYFIMIFFIVELS